MGELGLVHQFSEVMKPRMPEGEIFNAFKRRLLATRVRLLCVNCGEYNLVRTVREVDEQPECPKCNSRLIATIRKSQTNAVEIIKKKLKKKDVLDMLGIELTPTRLKCALLPLEVLQKAIQKLH